MKTRPSAVKALRTVYTAVDIALFSLAIALSLSLLFRVHGKPAIVFMIYVFVCLLVSFASVRIRAVKAEKACRKTEVDMKLDRILLMSDAEIGEKIREESFFLIRKEVPDRFDILEAIRAGTKAIGILSLSKEAEDTLNRNAPKLRIIMKDELLKKIFGTQRTGGRMTGITDKIRSVNKYFLLACILFLSSFFLYYKIYYRLIACVCLILSMFTGIFGDRKRWKNLWIFLDNLAD